MYTQVFSMESTNHNPPLRVWTSCEQIYDPNKIYNEPSMISLVGNLEKIA